MIKKFPASIANFAVIFASLQSKRHEADYDPYETFYKSAVVHDIAIAKHVIEEFAKADLRDKRAFAALVLLKQRKS